MKLSRFSLVLSAGLLFGGCAAASPASTTASTTPTQQTAKSVPGDATAYAAALEEAFEAYESQVQEATQIQFRSQAELDAVVASLSEARFDWNLREALARRNLTVDGLAEFALAHPDFFHNQQSRHWGRLARAQAALGELDFEAPASDTQVALMDETSLSDSE